MTTVLLQSAVLGMLAIITARVASRRLSIPTSWMFAAATAGMLDAVPSVLKSDTRLAFAAFRVLGLMLVGAAFVLLGRGIRHARLSRAGLLGVVMVGSPAVLGTLQLVVGLLRGNDLLLVAGDALRFVLTAAAVWVGVVVPRHIVGAAVVVGSLMAVGADLLSLSTYLSQAAENAYDRAGGGFPAAFALGLVGLLRAADGRSFQGIDRPGVRRPRPRMWLPLLILVIDVTASLLSLSRATWVALAVTAIAATSLSVLAGRVRSSVLITGSALASLAIAAVILANPLPEQTAEVLGRRLEFEAVVGAASVRQSEIDYASADQNSRWAGEVVGAGAGATYAYPLKEPFVRHSVHITFANVSYRGGGLSVGLFGLWWTLAIGLALVALVRAGRDPLYLWAAMTVLGMAVKSLAAFHLIGEPVSALAVGLVIRHVVASRGRTVRTESVSPRRMRVSMAPATMH